MVTVPSVLVLGAGASADYGFPLGRGLLHQIAGDLPDPSKESSQLLLACGHSNREQQAFAGALLYSQEQSVDAFLENRPDFLLVGKRAIAATLIPREQDILLAPNPETERWYEYLFQRLLGPPETLSNNKLSVITFNYDRSFERAFLLAMRHRYDLSVADAAECLSYVPVLHAYGQLGGLPERFDGPGSRPYTHIVDAEIAKEAAREIRIVHEGEDSEELKTARESILANAEVVCFLGFGYAETNLRRLGLHKDSALDTKRRQLFGSMFKLSDREKEAVNGMSVHTIDYRESDALQSLKQLPFLNLVTR